MQLKHAGIYVCIVSACSLYAMEQNATNIPSQYILTLPPELGHEIVGWLNPYTDDLRWIARVSGVDKQSYRSFSPIINKMYAYHKTLREYLGEINWSRKQPSLRRFSFQCNRTRTRLHYMERNHNDITELILTSLVPDREEAGEFIEHKKIVKYNYPIEVFSESREYVQCYVLGVRIGKSSFPVGDDTIQDPVNMYGGKDNTIMIKSWHISNDKKYIRQTKTYYSLDLIEQKKEHSYYTDIEKAPIFTSNIDIDDDIADIMIESEHNYVTFQNLDDLDQMELLNEKLPRAMQLALHSNNKEIFINMLDKWIIYGTKSIKDFPQKGTTVYADGLKNIYTVPDNLKYLPKLFHRLTVDDIRECGIQIINKGMPIELLETEIQSIFSSSKNNCIENEEIEPNTSDSGSSDSDDAPHPYYAQYLRHWEGPCYFGTYNHNLVRIMPHCRDCTVSTIRFKNNQWSIREHAKNSTEAYYWFNAQNTIYYMDDTNTILKNKDAKNPLIIKNEYKFNLLLTEQTLFPRYYQLKNIMSFMPWPKIDDYLEI